MRYYPSKTSLLLSFFLLSINTLASSTLAPITVIADMSQNTPFPSNNTQTINTVTLKNIFTAKNDTESLTHNTLYLHGDISVEDSIFTAFGEDGDALNNTLTLDAQTILFQGGNNENQLCTAFSKKGSVIGNRLHIKNGTVQEGWIRGGKSHKGDVIANHVEMSGGVATWGVQGAHSWRGDAKENSVVMSGNAINLNDLEGGHSTQGDAIGNTATITSGEVGWAIYGGNSEEGKALHNTVVVLGGKVGTKQGVLYGAYGGHGKTEASNNKLILKETGYIDGWTYGGYSDAGVAAENEVTIDGGQTGYYVSGGYGYANSDVYENTVTLKNGTVGFKIHGGYTNNGNALNNTVIASGGHIQAIRIENRIVGGDIYGGFSKLGNTIGNHVYIDGTAQIDGNIYGGFVEYAPLIQGKIHGIATNNTVTISGSPILGETSTIYGGGTDKDFGSKGDLRSGNTLAIATKALKVQNIINFETLHFTLQETHTNTSLITLHGSDTTDLTQTDIAISLEPNTQLNEGQSIVLIEKKSPSLTLPKSTTITTKTPTTLYTFKLSTNQKKLIATLLKRTQNETHLAKR